MAVNKSDHKIDVDVQTEYAAEHSDARQNRYVFIYHVCIKNNGSQAAQLISRHWHITDADGKIEEVRGDGVIGEQPLIEPGEEHCYSSFCVLETAVGCMQGSYQMLCADGDSFDAQVLPFTLAVPRSLN